MAPGLHAPPLSVIDPSRMGGALTPTVAPADPAEIGPTDVGQPTG